MEHLHKETGKLWYENIPKLIEQLCAYWHLEQVEAMPNLTYNYVAKAMQGQKPVILKIGYDTLLIEQEVLVVTTPPLNALRYSGGFLGETQRL